MEYHVSVKFHTVGGHVADEDRLDMAGGRLATLGPSMRYGPDSPIVEVTVMADAESPQDGLRDSITAIKLAFASVGEPLVFRSGQVFTVDEFEVELRNAR